jgi:uncharacterized membrane protein YqaE (UPF0057 family)
MTPVRYLLALVIPPVAVLSCGKPIQAILNVVLCFLLLVPGVAHAILVVHTYHADRRHRELIKVLTKGQHRSF